MSFLLNLDTSGKNKQFHGKIWHIHFLALLTLANQFLDLYTRTTRTGRGPAQFLKKTDRSRPGISENFKNADENFENLDQNFDWKIWKSANRIGPAADQKQF